MASAEKTTPEIGSGMTIFLDIFRRADKNDDGFISWEEFVSYFADGVMSKEELQTLFNEIDTHNTNQIDTEELCTYFSQHLGDFKEIFGTCEYLSQSMTKALYSTAEAYKTADKTGKFMMRFLMREIINQLSALQHPLEAASESLDEQAREESGNTTPLSPEDMLKKGDGPAIIPGRIVRRTKRQVSSQSNLSEALEQSDMTSGLVDARMQNETSNPALTVQVDRLAELLDHLESKVNLRNFRDEEVVEGEEQLVLLVQREFQVKEANVDEFRGVLRSYVDVTQGFHGCLNISVIDVRDSKSFSLYEMWRTEKEYIHNCDSAATKKLVETSAELLVKPEMVHSMKIPASWWTSRM